MTESTTRRQPTPADIIALAKVLDAFSVQYVVIGGAAMALHGYPRMTKDIDLLLPVDPENNGRLVTALRSLPGSEAYVDTLRQEFMDKGFSTSLEGELVIDLLYVAASRSFEDLRTNIQRVNFNGTPVVTLDVDGMLLTKETDRPSDLPDRLKLGRLKTAKVEMALQEARLQILPSLEVTEGPGQTFGRQAKLAIHAAGGARNVKWTEVEQQTIAECIGELGHSPESVAEALAKFSPGAIYASSQAAIRNQIERIAPELQRQYQSKQIDKDSGLDRP